MSTIVPAAADPTRTPGAKAGCSPPFMASISKTLQHDADGISLRTQVAGPVPRADEFSIFHRRGPWRDALRRRMLAAADALAVVAAGATVGTAFDGRLTLLWWTLLLPVWLVLAKVHGLYDRDHRVLRHLTADEFPALLAWATTGTAASAAILSLSGAEPLTVSTALKLWLAVLLVAATLRAFARWLWRTGTRPEQTLLLGSGPLEQAARRKIELFS